MEELDTIRSNYNNGFNPKNISKKSIEFSLLRELKKLEISNIKYDLIQWRYFKEDNEDIDKLRYDNLNRQQYLNVMENHISLLFNECREKFNTELKEIDNAIERKQKDIKRNEKRHEKETTIEEKVLKRLNLMPEDVVRYIGEFLFTHNIRNLLICHKYSPELFDFKKVRLPKLKTMSRILSLEIENIGYKISKNSNIMNSIPRGSNELRNIGFIRLCRTKVRETMTKPEKRDEIKNFILRCEEAINLIEKLGYPKTTNYCKKIMNKIYHIMILASKPENNKRR
jgi:hypothetical protein